jgi:predicted NACHT family NTPase
MGLELNHGSGVRLNHVYTPLATSARSDPERSMTAGRRGGPGDEADSKVQLLLESLDKQSLYVSGDPGSGKSTFCRWVTWLTCHGEMPEVDVAAPEEYQETFPASLRGRLPMLVRLRDFWQHLPPQGVRSLGQGGLEQSLERWLADQRYPGLDWACVQSHLDAGTALLMLDGVDEVPPVRGRMATNGIRGRCCWPDSPTPWPVGPGPATACWSPAARTG